MKYKQTNTWTCPEGFRIHQMVDRRRIERFTLQSRMRLQGLASCPLRLIEASRQATASRSGFTLLELILAVTVFAIIGGATAIPFASRFFNKNNLENKTNEVVSALFTAKLNSVSGKEHSQWGVHIDSTHIIMFKGSSYVPPGTTFDQTYDIPPTTTITTIDVAFNSTTGNPSAPQTIAISDALGDQHILSVNEVGSIDIN